MKYSFKNDYSSIAHPLVLQKLLDSQNEQCVGYGLDQHTENAKNLIKDKIKKDSKIYFVTGGTQANMIVISSILRPHEAVICADTGHINVHETGAIEGRGHKCLTIPTNDGKVTIEEVEKILNAHLDCHMVKPKMVYISNSTEVGTVYNKDELIKLYKFCKDKGLYLYLDGARLASALAASDITYEDLGSYTDVFYIGGTKNGGYIGEAIVINNLSLGDDFDYLIKHFGGMLAKGFVGAIPFEVLMDGNLYYDIGKKENEAAAFISKELKELGFEFLSDSPTNQIFPIVPNYILDDLYNEFLYEIWQPINEEYTAIRFVTSFTTRPLHCKMLIECIKNLINR